MRCFGGRPRHAMAMTSALSPDSRMLIHMILTSAIQNSALPISFQPLLTIASQLAGSIICVSDCTSPPPDFPVTYHGKTELAAMGAFVASRRR